MSKGEHFAYCSLFSFTFTFSGKHVLFFIVSYWLRVFKQSHNQHILSYVLRLDRVLDEII